MTDCFVVLGMHRSGTSLTAKMLHRMGVNMGDQLLAPNEFNPYGHWEDVNFFELNVEILGTAGGHWAVPPEEKAIVQAAHWLTHEIKWLLSWKATRHKRWGFKDPRTVLTIPVWDRWLQNPHYVIVRRDKEAVINSLERRAEEGGAGKDLGFTRNDWSGLYDEYDSRLREFLEENEQPAIGVEFEHFMSRSTAPKECARLADFVGGNPRAAYQAIKFKE